LLFEDDMLLSAPAANSHISLTVIPSDLMVDSKDYFARSKLGIFPYEEEVSHKL
jgi:hypothetical protein